MAASFDRMVVASLGIFASGCGGDCVSPETSQSVIADASYVAGDGTEYTTTDVEEPTFRLRGRSDVLLHGDVLSRFGEGRSFAITLPDMDVGSVDLATTEASLCVSGAAPAPACLGTISGTFVASKLSRECYEHESGVGTCIENLDGDLSIEASGDGLDFVGTFHLASAGEWGKGQCAD